MTAIIYVRVSSRDQVEGTSLETQEIACREYAKRHDLTVARVFVEEGESAKFADRTQLIALLDYCKVAEHAVSTLIVWKLDRFARNVEDHFAIKAMLRRSGVSVVSVTEPIAQDPNGKLMETILAGFAAFDNDVRAMRTVQGLQQKLKSGLFPWKAPLGYLPTKTGRKTEPDLVDPKRFQPLQKAWQLYATGAYSKAAILRLLTTWGVTGYTGKPLHPQALDFIFANPYYKGILQDPWTKDEYAGRHTPMVTPEEFAKVQQVTADRSLNQRRPHRTSNERFPLRGFVRCPSCHYVLTGALARGRHQYYPYYYCFQRNCPTRARSYRAEAVHDEFSAILRELSVPRPLCRAALADIRRVLDKENQAAYEAYKSRQEELRQLEHQLQELLSMRARLLITDAEFLAQRGQLLARRYTLQAKPRPDDEWLTGADEDLFLDGMADIPALWDSTPTAFRERFGNILFCGGYILNGLRTAERGLLFRVFSTFPTGTSNVVPLITSNLNQLRNELSKLLAIIRMSQGSAQRVQRAA